MVMRIGIGFEYFGSELESNLLLHFVAESKLDLIKFLSQLIIPIQEKYQKFFNKKSGRDYDT